MKNILKGLILSLFLISSALAFQTTTNYGFIIPASGDKDWLAQISNDIISIDTAFYIISQDETIQNIKLTILSGDAVIQDNKLTILSNDAVTWRANRVSQDASLNTLAVGNVSNTEIGYLDGVTSALQTQLSNRVSQDASLATLKLPSITSQILSADANGNIVGTTTGTGNMSYGNTRFAVVYFTCDISTTGSQAVTGVGFAPTGLIFFGAVEGTKDAFWGISAGTTQGSRIWAPDNAASPTTGFFSRSGSASDPPIGIFVDNSNFFTATIASLDSDGFTLTKSKTGTPTGTVSISCLAFR